MDPEVHIIFHVIEVSVSGRCLYNMLQVRGDWLRILSYGVEDGVRKAGECA